MKLIVEEIRIKNIQRRFQEKMDNMAERTEKCYLDYQSGNTNLIVSWSSKLGIWRSMSNITRSGTRFWNAFGVNEPYWNSNKSLSIICEINISHNGVNRNVQGAFIKDDQSRICLIHRGRIGGGKAGIGQKIFWDNYDGDECKYSIFLED